MASVAPVLVLLGAEEDDASVLLHECAELPEPLLLVDKRWREFTGLVAEFPDPNVPVA
jgi:hypothetical protein